jgi:hypothetical protein
MKFLNGWTKKTFMEQIKKKNKNQKVINNIGSCLYRDSDGACCLVGAFIPDDVYTHAMESRHAVDVIESYDLEDIMPFDKYTMDKLQFIHDRLSEDDDLFTEVEDFIKEAI